MCLDLADESCRHLERHPGQLKGDQQRGRKLLQLGWTARERASSEDRAERGNELIFKDGFLGFTIADAAGNVRPFNAATDQFNFGPYNYFQVPDERLNPNGGAVAIGHPFGSSGTRYVLTLATELRQRQARYGVLGVCVGSGQGVALVLENPSAQTAA